MSKLEKISFRRAGFPGWNVEYDKTRTCIRNM